MVVILPTFLKQADLRFVMPAQDIQAAECDQMTLLLVTITQLNGTL